MATKEVEQLLERVQRFEGVTINRHGKHPRIYRNGRFITVVPSTPSDRRWMENAKSILRRAGIDLDAQPTKRKETKSVTATQNDLITFPRSPHAPYQAPFRSREIGGGRVGLTADSADSFRAEVRGFLATAFPADTAPIPALVRFIMHFQGNHEGFNYKSIAACEMSIRNLVTKRNGMLTETATLVRAAMNAWRENPDLKLIEGVKPQKTKAKSKPKVVSKADAKEIVKEALDLMPKPEPRKLKYIGRRTESPYKDEALTQLWKTLDAFADEKMRQLSLESTEKYPYGKATLSRMGELIISQALAHNVYLRPKHGETVIDKTTVGRRIADFLISRKPRYAPEAWVQHELKLYVDLYKTSRTESKKVEQQQETETQIKTAIDKDVWNTFLDLVENKALPRTLLTEAKTLAEQIVRFNQKQS